MITKESIDKIFSAIRVEEVIGDFVSLKKSGSNYKGLSPFVDEKSPSFMVSPAKQIWKDFSSGKGGNAVSFLMELENYSYPEALRFLAKKYHIEIEENLRVPTVEEQQEKLKSESLYQISEFANTFFQNQLHQTEEGKNIGLSYFKERGFSKETIDKFQLGYSPKQKDAFTQHALANAYKKEIAEASGLSIFTEQGEGIDRFRDRVMFPIFSYSGRVLGFGGRILRSDIKTAKYLNSPESDIYHKSKLLYGLFQSKRSIIKQDNCLLVEGYTDVISLHQAGIENAVASSGTSLTEDQIRLIKRLTNNVTLLYDGDSAGIKASFRGIDMLLSQGLNIKVVLFPEGEDPDSFARKNSQEQLEKFLTENAKDFIQFKTAVLLEEAQGDPVKKAQLIKEIIQSIALVNNLIQREVYVKESSRLLSISEKVLFQDLAQTINSNQAKEQKSSQQDQSAFTVVQPEQTATDVPSIYYIEEELIQILLKYGNVQLEIPQENDEVVQSSVIEEVLHQLESDGIQLSIPFYQEMLNEIKIGLQEGELRTGTFFMQYFEEEVSEFVADSIIDKYTISENWRAKSIYVKPKESFVYKLVNDTILRYKTLVIQAMIDEIVAQINDENRITSYEKLQKYIQLKNSINQELNRVL